jgi:integrase
MTWSGNNPVSLMLSSERPKSGQSKRRRSFEGAEHRASSVEQTIVAADDPYRTHFTLAELTGARVSELLGLTWSDVHPEDIDDAKIEFASQVDRREQRLPTKTDGSARSRSPARSR